MTVRPLTATYRLQFSQDFTFEDARRLVPYLRDLGVSHLYASPIFQARPGSTHGYDVIDHDAINLEVGGDKGFRALVADMQAAGLGLVIDIVPNHAGIGGQTNSRWQDVLEFGRRSRNARFFDIDWNAGPLVMPVLTAPIADVAEEGGLALRWSADDCRFQLTVGDAVYPLRPHTVGRVLARAGEALNRPDVVAAGRDWAELEGQRAASSGRRARRGRVADLLREPAVDRAVAAALGEEDPVAVAEEQHYRLMYWREGAQAINYRRFFDITDLAGLRVEEPSVFEAVHRLPLALVQEGVVDGLRIDHIDGLSDPTLYCERLRQRVGPAVSIHVEKILGADEPLRPWPVEGTTGYELLNRINGLFVDPAGYERLAGRLGELGLTGGSGERIVASKREVLEESFSAELDVLARQGADLSRRFGHPVRLGTMREIVSALIAALPVYRTYIAETASPEDVRLLERAAASARHALSRGAKRALATLVEILSAGGTDAAAAEFIRRFQQLSGPAMAKGYEDTELYRFVALASVNEVGSHLSRPALAADDFHAAFQADAERGLASLVPLSTHDTKRGADTRARINVLSEMSEDWLALVDRWQERHAPLRRRIAGGEAPDRIDEGILYQVILGAWPIDAERIAGYVTKAVREAKRHSSWIEVDADYEEAAIAFAVALVSGEEGAAFRQDVEALLATVGPAGRHNALAQTVLQMTVPGIPDVYRGSEFYEHVLVDPDNRRPVDFDARIAALGTRGEGGDDTVGVVKQWTIARLLALRGEYPDLFRSGRYDPLPVMGARDVIAFARRSGDTTVVVLACTRALTPRVGDVLVDLGSAGPSRWRTVVGGRDVRQEGRLLRFDRSQMPTVVVGTPK